jgi:hypothetical protein
VRANAQAMRSTPPITTRPTYRHGLSQERIRGLPEELDQVDLHVRLKNHDGLAPQPPFSASCRGLPASRSFNRREYDELEGLHRGSRRRRARRRPRAKAAR